MARISNIGGGGGLTESSADALYLNESANLSDLDDASAARTNLGLAIGSNVQAWDANLDQIAALAPTDNNFIVGNGSAWALEAPSDVRTSLGLVIGTDVQAQDAELAALAGLTSAADRLPYFTGSGTASLATFTAAGRALLDDATAAAQIATLGLDADIATFALPASTTISVFGASLVDDADAATARTTLGLVAAGAGDIWVEKAGDTMTGNLVIDADHFLNIDGSVVFNETGADADFRIEGDTDTLLFNTEATANNVGIGVVPVTAKLHVKATAGSIAKFGDGTSDARFELLRDTGAGAVMLFHAGDAIMESDGNWQLKHEGGSKIKMKNSTNGAEVWIDTTTPSIYTGGGDNLILGRNQTTIITLVAAGATLVGDLDASGVIKIDSVQVVSNRVVDARIDDTINTTVWDSTTAGVLDAIRDACITHGLIAAA